MACSRDAVAPHACQGDPARPRWRVVPACGTGTPIGSARLPRPAARRVLQQTAQRGRSASSSVGERRAGRSGRRPAGSRPRRRRARRRPASARASRYASSQRAARSRSSAAGPPPASARTGPRAARRRRPAARRPAPPGDRWPCLAGAPRARPTSASERSIDELERLADERLLRREVVRRRRQRDARLGRHRAVRDGVRAARADDAQRRLDDRRAPRSLTAASAPRASSSGPTRWRRP